MRGKQTPVGDVCRRFPRGEMPAIRFPNPCPCLRVFIRGGRQTSVLGVQESPREPMSLPEHLPPTRLYLTIPLQPPNNPTLPSHPFRISPTLSRGRSPLLVICDTVHLPPGEATASIHHPYPCPCLRVFIRGGGKLLLAMCDTIYSSLFQGRSRRQSIAPTRVPAYEFLYEEKADPCLEMLRRRTYPSAKHLRYPVFEADPRTARHDRYQDGILPTRNLPSWRFDLFRAQTTSPESGSPRRGATEVREDERKHRSCNSVATVG